MLLSLWLLDVNKNVAFPFLNGKFISYLLCNYGSRYSLLMCFSDILQGLVPLSAVACRVVHSVHVIFYLENSL